MARRGGKSVSSVTMRIEGDDIVQKLLAVGEDTLAVTEKAAVAGAKVIQRLANPRAPGPNIETEVIEKQRGFCAVAIAPRKEFWYYRFFETGTQPHEVTVTSQQALKLYGLGDEFALAMMHPGMAARPFLRPAMDLGKNEAANAVLEVFKQAWRKHEVR